MIEPKRVLNHLARHWELIDRLFEQVGDGTITLQGLRGLLALARPHWDAGDISLQINTLLGLELLIPVAKSHNRFELNPTIMEFVGYLKHEHRLGLSMEIQAYVEHLRALTERIGKATEEGDRADLSRFTRLLDQRIREVIKKLRNDELALEGIAERARTRGRDIPLKERYAEVLSSWDEYVEPMIELVRHDGLFDQTVRHIERQLQRLARGLDLRGGLLDDSELLGRLQARLMDMEAVAHHTLKRATEILLPLREEIRRNDALSRGASLALATLRKKGPLALDLQRRVPLFARPAINFFGSHGAVQGYLYAISRFQPSANPFPERNARPATADRPIIGYPEVRARFIGERPVADAMAWLITHYPEVGSDELLYWFSLLARDSELPKRRLERAAYATPGHRLRLTSYHFPAR